MRELRPYQQEAIEAVCAALQRGVTKQCLVMSMGLGKTFTAIKIQERLDLGKTAWITDDEGLIEQSGIAYIRDKESNEFANRIEQSGFIDFCKNGGLLPSGLKVSLVKADEFDLSGDIVFVSAQTLWRRLDKTPPDTFGLVIIDEAHCFGAKTFFMGIEHLKPSLRLGLTGTPLRKDGVMMDDIFDEIVFDYGMDKGIRDGYLCELDAIRIKTSANLDSVRITAGDFNQKDLSNEINTLARNNQIAESYLKYCKGRQAIGYGVDISHCIDLADAFKGFGIRAEAISSDEERTGDRCQKIKDYKSGKIEVIFNVNLLQKGFDHPDTGCTISAAPTKSIVRYLQGPAGRASRLKSDGYVAKFGQNAIILDVVDNTSKHNLINAWELDKLLPPEERLFVSKEKKEKLIAERAKRTLGITRDKDERVKLLSIPKLKIHYKGKWKEPATSAQLKWVYDLGYSKDANYTKEACSQIIMSQPATEKQVSYAKYLGYDVSQRVVLTRRDFEAIIRDAEKRKNPRLKPIKK